MNLEKEIKNLKSEIQQYKNDKIKLEENVDNYSECELSKRKYDINQIEKKIDILEERLEKAEKMQLSQKKQIKNEQVFHLGL